MSRPRDWSVRLGPEQTSLLAEILNCHQVFGWLTKTQRAALLGDGVSSQVTGHPTVIANLRKRGLVDDRGRLTEVGALVRRWNKPQPKRRALETSVPGRSS